MFIILTLSPPYITLNNSKFIHQYWISIFFSTQRNEKMTKDWLKLLYLLTKCKYFKISITFAEKWSSRLIQNLEQCWILIINIYQLNTCRAFNNTFIKSLPNIRHVQIVMCLFECSSPILYWPSITKNIFRTEILWIGQKQLRLQCVIKINFFVILKHFEYPHII